MTRTRWAAALTAAGSALLLSACSFLPGAGGGGATPAPAAVSVEDSGAAFVGTICPFNEGARAFAGTWTDDAATLRELQEAASLAQREAENAQEELETTAWPAGVAEDMDVIVAYLEERRGKFDQVLEAETLEELDSIELATTPDAVNESASRIEEALALDEGYCPAAPDEEPTLAEEVADGEDLVGTTWTGTDSDGDDTSITFSADNAATVVVSDVTYEGTWAVADGEVTIDVTMESEALSYLGSYAPGVTAMNLSGTADNGHTWSVLVTNL